MCLRVTGAGAMPLSAKVSCVLDIARRVNSEGEKVRAGCKPVQPGVVRTCTRALFACVCVFFRVPAKHWGRRCGTLCACGAACGL